MRTIGEICDIILHESQRIERICFMTHNLEAHMALAFLLPLRKRVQMLKDPSDVLHLLREELEKSHDEGIKQCITILIEWIEGV